MGLQEATTRSQVDVHVLSIWDIFVFLCLGGKGAGWDNEEQQPVTGMGGKLNTTRFGEGCVPKEHARPRTHLCRSEPAGSWNGPRSSAGGIPP